MIAYTERRGEKPFDWNKFLNKENITDEEWEHAAGLSSDWITCACGNLCDIIPRNVAGCPEDDILYTLGIDFDNSIDFKQITRAKKTLHKIEERSAFLIKELIKELLKDES